MTEKLRTIFCYSIPRRRKKRRIYLKSTREKRRGIDEDDTEDIVSEVNREIDPYERDESVVGERDTDGRDESDSDGRY